MKTVKKNGELYIDWTQEVETNSTFARNINKLNLADIMNKLEISLSNAQLLNRQAFKTLLREEVGAEKTGK